MSVVLGLDLGTSAVKCVASRAGKILGEGTSELSISSPQPGWSEQNPSDWVVAARQAILQAINNIGVSGAEVTGIGLSGQMHGAVLLGPDDTPLRPCVLWNDNRSTKECEDLAVACPDIGQIGGVPPLPGFTAPKLMWVARNEPDIYAKIKTILLPKDYLAFWLTGNLSQDLSDAAGTLWLDQANRCWSNRLVEASGISADRLPTLNHGFDRIGDLRAGLAGELGLPAGIPVFAGGGDAATGAVSLGAASAGKCFMSLGTSGQLLVVDESYQPNPDQFVHAFCHTLPGLWYRMAAMLNGARPMSWFAGVLGISVAELVSDAAEADPSRTPVFLPYLNGERSPHGDPNIRSGFYGMEGATGRAELCRAVTDAVAFTMKDAADSFGVDFQPTGPVPVIGGGSKGDLVMQTLANVLGFEVARSDAGRGGAALGAALLAEVGIEARSLEDLSFNPGITDVFVPSFDPGLNERLGKYRELYKNLSG